MPVYLTPVLPSLNIMRQFLTAFCLQFLTHLVLAQDCTTRGQTPSTAFPVCGTSTFNQTNVPICETHSLVVPGCTGAGYADKNPFWYKFTCFQSGSLAFLIKPANQGDDYDWQLYDITGRDPNEVFTDSKLIVTGNWAGTYGNTGASASGVNFIQCASDPAANKNSFSTMPNLIAGHTYLLLVSHFTDTQSGYGLSFSGGTAVITDTTLPMIKAADASCGGDVVRVKLNKKMKCSTIATNGSDFAITPGNLSVTSANAFGCSNGFDSDSIELKLSDFLPPGTYTLKAKKGTDGNTILDYCDNAISDTLGVSFTVYPKIPTPMDSMVPLTCAPRSVRLVFKKPMICSTVAPDGSDFAVTGPYPVTVSGATGSCGAGSTLSNEIVITFSQPLYNGGVFTLTLKPGTDGNTILNECGMPTTAGSTLTFTLKDTVNADFSYLKTYGCTVDTVNYFHPGANGVTSWKWNLDENKTSTQQNPQALYQVFDTRTVTLAVTNGFCSDTATRQVALTNYLKASFTAFEDNCPNEPVQFTSTAVGNIQQHQWSFGDGGSSTDLSPTYIYSGPDRTTAYPVTYTVTDSIGCKSTASKPIKIYSSCYLAVPNAFTPNNDGKNDYLRVLNAIKSENLDFRIFNRWGQLVFQTNNWKQGWDGTIRGVPQGMGVYVWFLRYTDRDTHQAIERKGTATLIR